MATVTAPVANTPATREFSTLEGVAFMISGLGIQFSSELFAQWGSFFYSPSQETGRIIYVPIALVSIIFVFGRAFDILIDPWIGSWSDRMSTGAKRLIPIAGRRRPLIFWGSILMSITGVAFWYPPVAGESVANLIYGTIVMTAHWVFYALAYIPILALAPEIARSESERVRLGVWIAVGMTLGLVGAVVLPGILIERLDPARAQAASMEAAAGGLAVRYSPVGYQRAAIILALISLASFQFLVWTVKERYAGEACAAPKNFLAGLKQSLESRVFRQYLFIFGIFYIAVLAMQRAAPYWVELGLGGDESTITELGIPYLATSLLAILVCPRLARRYGVKRLTVGSIAIVCLALPFMFPIARMSASNAAKLLNAKILYGVVGVSLGLIYVLATPLLGAIIDEDERANGARRDALFNALNTIMVKAGQILSIVLADSLMSVFGNSVSRPMGVFLVGPVGGAICIVALVAANAYPDSGPAGGSDS